MRYFINGTEVTEEQAKQQEQENERINNIENNEDWLKEALNLNFIVKID